ncbi:MAG: hypothetical protein M0005_09030 [Actinomycetota bacterium]|nr:hypothetical protein [Actinomycetota bacterium]
MGCARGLCAGEELDDAFEEGAGGGNPPSDLLVLSLLPRSVVAPGCLTCSTGAGGDEPERIAQWAADLGYDFRVVGM